MPEATRAYRDSRFYTNEDSTRMLKDTTDARTPQTGHPDTLHCVETTR
jgi:hypothetical protein